MEMLKRVKGLLSLVVTGVIQCVIWVHFEYQLWTLRHQGSRLIRWALRYPNDQNLGNLILFRHRLRQLLYHVDQTDEPSHEDLQETWAAKRLMLNTNSTIQRLEQAILQTEESLQ